MQFIIAIPSLSSFCASPPNPFISS
uniref:Uncharacterized protein n=1 Tax=Rhizophora mucronata TaxID=61149 RepID=A0A2P2Q5H9_RHIMU